MVDSVDSEPNASQPTQLLQHALAPAPQNHEHDGDVSPNKDADDFSLDSRIALARSVPPRYILAEDSQSEKRQKSGELTADTNNDQGSGSGSFHPHGDNSISASIAKVIGTRSLSSLSPSTPLALHPTKSMPVGNRHYRRSPSPAFPSQDSLGGPISQDPAEQYIAATKQFHVPLSELGETSTQEDTDPHPQDPGATLQDASEHREMLELAMRRYDKQRAEGLPSNRLVQVVAPIDPAESSDMPQHDIFRFNDTGSDFAAQESRFEFNGSSSFDKMLDRGLADAPDPTPGPNQTQTQLIEPPEMDSPGDVQDPTKILTTPPRSSRQRSPSPFDWVVPAASAAVASSNPRSLLRMVHPDNHYRIAKMRYLAGKVEPRPCIATDIETQPCGTEETQPCHASESSLSPARPASHRVKSVGAHPTVNQHRREDEDEDLEDSLDVVPDSEPLRAGSDVQTPNHKRAVMQSPLKKIFRPLSPMSEHGSGDIVPNSLEVEGSEADIPLAVEMASKSTRVASAENMTVHDNKTRTTVPTKVPALALEKQYQRPTSSSTGKNSRTKPSEIEPMEVPTSLPEQDLQGQALSSGQHLAVTRNVLPSKKKETLKPSLARPRSTTRLPVIKPVVSNKRVRKSDTESSEDSTCQPTEDEGDIDSRTRKEEEEESTDDHHANLVSLPPPPRRASRNKKRRTEDIHPARATAKTSALTRNKPSETPAIATRSAKRVHSGMSSVRELVPDPASRVFALWKQDGHYYSGIVHSRGLKNKYLVKFDDGTEDEVELKNMRRRELLVGDRVIIIQDNIKAVVIDASDADSSGSFTLEADNGSEVATRPVGFGGIRIANRTIQSQWKDRTIVAESIISVVKPKTPIQTTPSRQSVTSTTSGKVQRELVKTGFVVTINPKNEKPVRMKEEVMHAIKQRGGLVIEDWTSVFTMEGKHSQSNKRWIATSQDFCWRPNGNLDRVFLLSDDAHQKPKFLLALALGIPCLSFEWVIREGKLSSDWQPFLLPAGYSDTLGARISQLIDLDWGNCTEHLTDIMENEVPIKLFSQKTVLCVGAELVPLPPHRAKKSNNEEASRCVPWIILCMGAAKVEAIADTKQVALAHMESFDYIIVKERHVLGPLKLGDGVVVGDVNWVKECLVSSRLFVPKLD